MILNIGAGMWNRQSEEVALDIDLSTAPDVRANVEKLPFKDKTCKIIRACHVLEHVNDIVATMNECERVLEEDGLMQIIVPHFPSTGAIADPTHKRFFLVDTFGYFIRPGALTGLRRTFEIIDLKKTKEEIYAVLRKSKSSFPANN